MLAKNVFSFLAELSVLLTLVAFMAAYNGANVCRRGICAELAGATATLLPGSIAAEQKLFDFYDVNKVRVPCAIHRERSAQSLSGKGAAVASRTAWRHSRLIGRMGGIGAVSGASVGSATVFLRSCAEPFFMNRL